MKKKVFSKLLMGALLVASVSSFTSCKDYDDDINDLRSQINGLNTSLNATVTDKLATVTNQVTTLSAQLNEVKTAYATADAALQKAIDAVEATGTVNAANINALQQELVNLGATDANLTQAIAKLQEGQDAAALLLSAQSLSITELAAADKTLEAAIAAAQAQADNALAEAKKAQETAANNYTALSALIGANNTAIAEANKEIANLQKQITDNLASVNAKIADEIAKLDARIKTNETNIAALQQTAAANQANITTITAKLAELDATDKSISAALDAAKTKLADDQKAAVEDLQKQITANAAAIQSINEKTIEDLAKHVIPSEISKQLAEALPAALVDYLKGDEVKALIEASDAKEQTLIDALTAKVKADSATLAAYTDAQLLLAVQLLTQEATDEQKATSAYQLAEALKAAQTKLNGDISTVKGDLETAKSQFTTTIQNMTNPEAAGSLAQKIAAVEQFFAPAGEELSIKNLAQKLAEDAEAAKILGESVSDLNKEASTMITSVNLFTTVEDHIGDHSLDFVFAKEQTTTFGKKDVTTTDEFKFEEGKVVTYADSVLIRVSPVNAKLTKDMITLVNSKGQAVQNVVVEDVYAYNELITRGISNNGLWMVKFNMKKDYTDEEFNADALYNGQHIVYAVAVRNTTKDIDANEDRYVISEYDLDLAKTQALHAQTFTVNGKFIEDLHNRFLSSEDAAGNISTMDVPELNYIAGVDAVIAEDLAEGVNYENRGGDPTNVAPDGEEDNRQNKPFLTANVGDEIKIEFPEDIKIRGFFVAVDTAFAVESQPSEDAAWSGYTYENVGKADLNAVKVPATLFEGNKGTIKITSLKASGDYIGFRVYAVNLDGTLFDPDGKSFYVHLGGDATTALTWNATIEAMNDLGVILDKTNKNLEGILDNDLTYKLVWGDENPLTLNGTPATTWTGWYQPIVDTRTAKKINPEGAPQNWVPENWFIINLYDKNNTLIPFTNDTQIANAADVDHVEIGIQAGRAARLLDNETYKLKLVGYKTIGVGGPEAVFQTITINITKSLPNALPSDFRLRTGQDGNLTVLMAPSDGFGTINWNQFDATTNEGNAAWGIDILPYNFADIYAGITDADYINYNSNGATLNYHFTIKNSQRDAADTKDIDLDSKEPNNLVVAAATTNYSIPDVATRYVGDGVKHDIVASYVYRGVSLTMGTEQDEYAVVRGNTVDNNGDPINNGDFEIDQTKNIANATYVCALDLTKLGRAKDQTELGKVTGLTSSTSPKVADSWSTYNGVFAGTWTYGQATPATFDLHMIFGKQTLTANQLNKASLGTALVSGAGSVMGSTAALRGTPKHGSTQKTFTLGQMLDENIVKIVGDITLKTDKDNGWSQINEYYTATQDATNAWQLNFAKKQTSTQQPHFTKDVPTLVSFKIQDAFGHEQLIEFELTMKKPAEARQAR